MSHFSVCASSLRRQAATLSALVAVLALASASSAASLDFNVPSGNFNTAANWVDQDTAAPAAAAPTIVDTTTGDIAYVRNGGTVTINNDVYAQEIRIGAKKDVTNNPDYDGNGFVDAADYVLWRKGSLPLANDLTPDTAGPEDYLRWRARYGGANPDQLGGSGTLMWTAGEIFGRAGNNDGYHAGGPRLYIGRHVNIDATHPVEYDFPGVVVQNGATTQIMLRGGPATDADRDKFNIGENGTTPTPHSSYTLMNGTIGLAIGGAGLQGANGNDGINVRNGYFTMTGGQIIDATPDDLRAGTLTTQRFLTVASGDGDVSGTAGTENYASATLTGGNIDVLGGIRVAPGQNSRGYLTINGNMNIITGGDTSIGYNANNGVGQMDMSAGTLTVGRVYVDPVSGASNSLTGRLQVGHRGRGTLNMSGGTINVTRDVRVGTELAAGGSIITMTGGTINTPALNMGVSGTNPYLPTYAGSTIILNSPTASFLQSGSGGSIIGDHGKALFEVQQGTALLGGGGSTTQVGNTVDSQATINVKGGKLTIGGTLLKSAAGAAAPVIGLTGGTLEWNNTVTTAAQSFQADINNTGTTLVTKANTQLQVIPNNFAMSGGAWNIDIGFVGGVYNVLGADWFNANTTTGTVSLTGGTLNINYLSGFAPLHDQVFRILRGGNGATLTAGGVTIAGAGAGNWVLQTVPITSGALTANDTEIQLKYTGFGSGSGGGLGSSTVPEPASVALCVFAAAGLLTARRPRSRAKA